MFKVLVVFVPLGWEEQRGQLDILCHPEHPRVLLSTPAHSNQLCIQILVMTQSRGGTSVPQDADPAAQQRLPLGGSNPSVPAGRGEGQRRDEG